nr:hypothetical protein [Aquihabitans sp. G128]
MGPGRRVDGALCGRPPRQRCFGDGHGPGVDVGAPQQLARHPLGGNALGEQGVGCGQQEDAAAARRVPHLRARGRRRRGAGQDQGHQPGREVSRGVVGAGVAGVGVQGGLVEHAEQGGAGPLGRHVDGQQFRHPAHPVDPQAHRRLPPAGRADDVDQRRRHRQRAGPDRSPGHLAEQPRRHTAGRTGHRALTASNSSQLSTSCADNCDKFVARR